MWRSPWADHPAAPAEQGNVAVNVNTADNPMEDPMGEEAGHLAMEEAVDTAIVGDSIYPFTRLLTVGLL